LGIGNWESGIEEECNLQPNKAQHAQKKAEKSLI